MLYGLAKGANKMTNFEKVIKGLECCKTDPSFESDCEDKRCPYKTDLMQCINHLCADALELLKEQYNCENCAIAIEGRQLVVRCKDCKWYKEGYDIDGKWFSRCNGSVRTYGHTKPDWFCADGERAVKWE